MHICKVEIDFFLYFCNNQDPSIAIHLLGANLLGTLSAQAYVRTWGGILTHFCSFWRGKGTWSQGQFAQLGFRTFLYIVKFSPEDGETCLPFSEGTCAEEWGINEPAQGSSYIWPPLGMGDASCEWTVLLGFVSWHGKSQGKSLRPLSDHTNRIANSLLLFHCTGRVAECKCFSHLFISISESICRKWWAHKITAQ